MACRRWRTLNRRKAVHRTVTVRILNCLLDKWYPEDRKGATKPLDDLKEVDSDYQRLKGQAQIIPINRYCFQRWCSFPLLRCCLIRFSASASVIVGLNFHKERCSVYRGQWSSLQTDGISRPFTLFILQTFHCYGGDRQWHRPVALIKLQYRHCGS